jgi:hypothetical protein
MARPSKNGLDYFPLDVDIDQDDKVAMIEALHGIEGFGVLIKILMRIYKEGYCYEWNEKEQILFSKRVNVDINRVNVIINDCVRWGMFDNGIFNSHKMLTSKGIQMRFLEVCKRRNVFEMSKELILVPLNLLEKYKNIVIVNDNQVNVNNNEVNVNICRESKVKESKVKESKVKESKVDNSMSVGTDDQVPQIPKIDYQSIMIYWNENSKLKEITAMTDKRKSNINARVKDYSIDSVFKAIDNVSNSSFLRGSNKQNWIATFDWVFLPNNFVKVLEGNYLDKINNINNEIEERAKKVNDFFNIGLRNDNQRNFTN